MRWRLFTLTLVATAVGAVSGPGTAAGSSVTTPSASAPCETGSTAAIKHVIVIMEENHSYDQVIGSSSARYLNTLASECGLAANYHNTDHPSAPNYIELTSGTVDGKANANDCSYSGCPQPQNNLFNELDSAGKSWRSYAESAASNCQTYDTALYAQRHVPAVYYSDIHSTTCQTNVVPMTTNQAGGPAVRGGAFYRAVKYGRLPDFSFVTPNLCDDGHSYVSGYSYCGSNLVENLDNWLKAWVPFILNGPNYASGDTMLMIIFDEGRGSDSTRPEACWDQSHSSARSYPSCWVPAVFVGPRVPQLASTAWFNHYNTLTALAEILGVPPLPGSSTYGYATPNDLYATFGLGSCSLLACLRGVLVGVSNR